MLDKSIWSTEFDIASVVASFGLFHLKRVPNGIPNSFRCSSNLLPLSLEQFLSHFSWKVANNCREFVSEPILKDSSIRHADWTLFGQFFSLVIHTAYPTLLFTPMLQCAIDWPVVSLAHWNCSLKSVRWHFPRKAAIYLQGLWMSRLRGQANKQVNFSNGTKPTSLVRSKTTTKRWEETRKK